MNDALTQEPSGPTTDALVVQHDAPRPIEAPKPSFDDALRANVDKVVKDAEKPEAKPGPKPDTLKAEKPEAKPTPEPKPEAKLDTPKQAETAPPDDQGDDEAPEAPAPKPSAYREPPSGFDDAAKKEWETTPESVRGAVHRRAQEMERGIHKYRQDAEQFEPVRKFAEMAKQSGTDLPTALHRYVGMEQELRRDPISGLQAVVANLGLKKNDGSPVTLRDVAASIMGQPANQAASRQDATISHLTQTISQLEQKISGFSQHMEQQQQQSKTMTAESEWTAFQNANPDAADLEDAMAEALQMQNPDAYPSLTQRLKHAYAVAKSQYPSVAHTDVPPLVQTQTTPRAANPAGQKSISGAGGETRSVRKETSDEAIKRAIAKLNG